MLGKCISGIRIRKILLGEDPDPRMGFATSVLAGSGSTRHGLPQAKNPSYAPDVAMFLQQLSLL